MTYPITSILLACAIAFTFNAYSQPLSIGVQSIDASKLPHIVMKAKMYRNGMPVQQPNRAVISLFENGRQIQAEVDCPDSASFNSIALVLDNSGTMSGNPITALITAANQFIDSLRMNDEAMLIDFSQPDGYILQDLTTDKALLKSKTSGLLVGGNTPLWSASLKGVQRVAARPGKKICIVFTDGTDNSSTMGPDSIINTAVRAGVVVYTIGFGSMPLADRTLAELADKTGGRFFRIFAAPEIISIFNTIVSEVVSGACTITWDASGCTDSMRALHMEARLENETAVWDSLWHAPYRSDTLTLRVAAPREVGPGGNANVYIAVEPGLHSGLQVSFSFLLRYNPGLLNVTPVMPISLGTMAQNTSSTLRMLRPGVLQFKGDAIGPAFNTGNLIGVRFKGVAADSSRRVELALDSVVIDAGCDLHILTIPDTIDVCQCHEPVVAWLDTLSYALVGREYGVSVHVLDTAWTHPVTYDVSLVYDASRLTPVRVETDSTMSSLAGITWEIEKAGELRITAARAFMPARAGTLAAVVFSVRHGKESDTTSLVLPYVRAYSRCCPDSLPDVTGYTMVEGICDRLVQRRPNVQMNQNTPNPVSRERGWTSVTYIQSAAGHITMELFDAVGRKVRTILDQETGAGEHVIDIPARDLPAGVYTILLRSETLGAVAKQMVVR
jgi:hypothetical protein